ncbi:MAG: hypothetical protein IPJ60_15350 [Sphingobacteriaceae bacterium]|nr:hypothetical protein [Sphingobacteriaceae bacterium]
MKRILLLLAVGLAYLTSNSQTHYYLMQGVGNVLLANQWTTDPTGASSIAPPVNLQVPNSIFHFTNRASAGLGNFLTDNTVPPAPGASTCIIESGFNLTLNNTFGKLSTRFLKLASNATLTIKMLHLQPILIAQLT